MVDSFVQIAGIDESNVKDGHATLLPINSDVSAQKIRDKIMNETNKNVAIIISDTFGRPFRIGQTNHAIGISGLNPILDYEGTLDSFGKIPTCNCHRCCRRTFWCC